MFCGLGTVKIIAHGFIFVKCFLKIFYNNFTLLFLLTEMLLFGTIKAKFVKNEGSL